MKFRLMVASILAAIIMGIIAVACKSMEWHSDGYFHVANPQGVILETDSPASANGELLEEKSADDSSIRPNGLLTNHGSIRPNGLLTNLQG